MPHDYVPLSVDSNEDISSKVLPNGGVITIHGRTGEYTYCYGPPGLQGLLNTKYAVACSLFASLGGLTFGYDQGVISNILVMRDFVHRFPLSPFQVGLLTAFLELGALVGALQAGVFADKYSRRHSIVLASVIFCVGSLLQTVASSVGVLMLGRAIGGVGIGALSMLCPLYISEMSSPETRGSLTSLEQFSIVLGVVIGFWAGFITRNIPGAASWRIPLGVQIIPGVVLAVGTFWLPPSPRLLLLRGYDSRAENTLVKLRGREAGDPLLQLELSEMKVEVALANESADGHDNDWSALFGPALLKRTMIGVGVMFFQQWSGINALLYYGPSLMHSIGLEGDTVSLVMSGFINVMQLIAVIPAFFLLDSIGRRPLLKGGAIVMAISHLSVAILIMWGSSDWNVHRPLAWVAVGMIYIFTAAYGVSFGPVAWVLPTEVFPLSFRSKGAAISTASNWFNNFLIGLITPPLVHATPAGTFFLLAFACILGLVWTILFVPETKGVSLEEMDLLFSSSVGQNEMERRRQAQEEVGIPSLLREIMDS